MKTLKPLSILLLAWVLLGSYVQAQNGASEMLERTLPAVVTVAIHQTEDTQVFGFGSDATRDAYARPLELVNTSSVGSGFILKRGDKHYVVTNAHVIDGASGAVGAISAFTINQSNYIMKLVGADTFYDLAVLEFVNPPGSEIHTVEFRDSDIRIGEKVYAIGNPLGDYPYSVSDGIIGGMNRISSGLTSKFGYLQSTAVIESGNSGGPLVDAGGQVVGINTYGKYPYKYQFGQYVSSPQLNFSLDYRIAKKVVSDIISSGRVLRPFFGIALYQDYDAKGNYPTTAVYLGDVLNTSPNAAKLQSKVNATLEAIDGQPIKNLDQALRLLEGIKAGGSTSLTLVAAGQSETVTLTSGDFGAENKKVLASYVMGKYTPLRPYESEQWIYFNTSFTGDYAKYFVREGYFDDSQKKYVKITDAAMKTPATGGIFYFAGSSGQDWSPRSLEQIGTIIKLAALSGYLQIKTSENKVWYRHYVYFSEDASKFRKVLFN